MTIQFHLAPLSPEGNTSGDESFTGTGIITPEDMPLADGDIVEIEIDGLGKLSNPVKQL